MICQLTSTNFMDDTKLCNIYKIGGLVTLLGHLAFIDR